MMNPDFAALVEARQEAFEAEARLQSQLALLPQKPARWRKWTSGGLMWAGASLVHWGEGLRSEERQHGAKAVS